MAALDPTFRNYGNQQAAAYATNRGPYSLDIHQQVLEYHTRQGANLGTILDVGCGTGQAIRTLGSFFSRATGCDPGVEMIAQARKLGGETKDKTEIRYEVLGAEELEKSTTVEPGSVDLLVSAMAAHWFHMRDFWPQAARMVRPGGTVALWTKSSLYCHPSTPNAGAVQEALSHLEDDTLGPYELPENNISRTMYANLGMPWSVDPPVAAFPESSFVRREWNRDGKLGLGEDDFFGGSSETTLEQLERSLGTASMVTRWREAHPRLVGTDNDCVVLTMKAVATALGRANSSFREVKIRVGSSTTLLLFRRTSDK